MSILLVIILILLLVIIYWLHIITVNQETILKGLSAKINEVKNEIKDIQ